MVIRSVLLLHTTPVYQVNLCDLAVDYFELCRLGSHCEHSIMQLWKQFTWSEVGWLVYAVPQIQAKWKLF